MKRWLGVLALLALAGWSVGFSQTQRTIDAKYRWHHQVQTVASTNIMIRFPRKETASNVIPVDPDSIRSVDFVELIQYDLTGGFNSEFVVYSRTFPAGRDTVRCNGNIRTQLVSGAIVDSVQYLGSANIPIIGVTAGGAY